MDKYAKYLKELKNYELIEDQDGFATYGYQLDSEGAKVCYIEEIYVIPEKRKKGIASKYADLVVVEAKKNGCSKLYGTVVPSLPGSHYRLLTLLGYGFKLTSSSVDLVWFSKEI